MPRELSATAEPWLARLDRVPLSSFHWRLRILSGLGWMFDAMDVLMLSFLLTPIRGEFKLDATGVGLVASATFVGMFVGAAAAGRPPPPSGPRAPFSAPPPPLLLRMLLSLPAPPPVPPPPRRTLTDP